MAFLYNLPSDNISDAITPTVVEGTANATYGVANLANDNLALPFKAATLGAGVELALRYDFISTVGLRFFSLHNFSPDVSSVNYIKLISDTSSDILTPGTRAEFTATYSGFASDGYSIDPYIGSALAAATARRYWYAVINVTAGLPQIGRIWMSTILRSLNTNFRYESHAYDRAHPAIHHETNMGVRLSYPRGIRQETLSGVMRVSATDFAALKELFDIAGESRAFPIVPDSSGGPIVSVASECHLVRFAPGTAFAPRFTPNAGPGLMDVQVAFVMVSRGMRL